MSTVSPRDALPEEPHSPTVAATRFARQRRRALGSFFVGALLLPAIIGVFWLKSGRIDPLAIGVAVGFSTLVDMLGVAQLVVRAQAMQRYQVRLAEMSKGAAARTPLQIHFCRRSLGRLGPDADTLLTGLRARGHTPTVKECLNSCQDCNRGTLVTMVDGTPMNAVSGDKLLQELDELAATES